MEGNEIHRLAVLEDAVRNLGAEIALRAGPKTEDLDTLARKLKTLETAIDNQAIEMKVARFTRSDVYAMITQASANSKQSLVTTLKALFESSDFREQVTADAVEQLRKELRTTAGSASEAANASARIARTTVDLALSDIKAYALLYVKG